MIEDKNCIVLNFFGLNGVVDKIKGVDVLAEDKNIYDIKLYTHENDTIENSTSVFRKIAMFTIVAKKSKSLLSTVDKVNSIFDICDKEENSLIYEKVSGKELNMYYNENV